MADRAREISEEVGALGVDAAGGPAGVGWCSETTIAVAATRTTTTQARTDNVMTVRLGLLGPGRPAGRGCRIPDGNGGSPASSQCAPALDAEVGAGSKLGIFGGVTSGAGSHPGKGAMSTSGPFSALRLGRCVAPEPDSFKECCTAATLRPERGSCAGTLFRPGLVRPAPPAPSSFSGEVGSAVEMPQYARSSGARESPLANPCGRPHGLGVPRSCSSVPRVVCSRVESVPNCCRYAPSCSGGARDGVEERQILTHLRCGTGRRRPRRVPERCCLRGSSRRAAATRCRG